MTIAIADYHYIREEPVVGPGELDLPPELADVLDNLTSEGRRAFIRELAEALELSQKENDFRPALAVVEAYYRTLLVRRHPRYAERRKQAANPRNGTRLSVSEVKQKLGL